jgi:hypothetical protein
MSHGAGGELSHKFIRRSRKLILKLEDVLEHIHLHVHIQVDKPVHALIFILNPFLHPTQKDL